MAFGRYHGGWRDDIYGRELLRRVIVIAVLALGGCAADVDNTHHLQSAMQSLDMGHSPDLSQPDLAPAIVQYRLRATNAMGTSDVSNTVQIQRP
jgi:hypothetical protein